MVQYGKHGRFVVICSLLMLSACNHENQTEEGNDPGTSQEVVDSLSGNWISTERQAMISFSADGSFFFEEFPTSSGPNGRESGTYSATETTMSTTVTTDGIGASLQQDGGIDNYGNALGWSYTITNSQLSMTIAGTSTILTFDKMTADSSHLGNWQTSDGSVALVFNSDGTFTFTEVSGELPNGSESGVFFSDASAMTTIVTDDQIGAAFQQDGGIDNYGNPLSWTYSVNTTGLSMTIVSSGTTLNFVR